MRYPNSLVPDSHETSRLPSGDEVHIPKTRPTFKRWTGEFEGDTYGNKPILDFEGEPMFAELAILRIFQKDGRDGMWVDTFRRKYRTSSGDGGVELPEDTERLLQEIFEKAGSRAGCFDVFWKGDSVGFVGSKQASKDEIRPRQVRWIEAALSTRLPAESLLVME